MTPTRKVYDMHRQPLSVRDRIWLPSMVDGLTPTGRAMGDQAVVTAVDPDGFFGEGTVDYRRLSSGKLGSLRAAVVRLRRPGPKAARRKHNALRRTKQGR